MKLVDMMPIEDWIAIEKEIQSRSGLNAAVYDVRKIRNRNFEIRNNSQILMSKFPKQ